MNNEDLLRQIEEQEEHDDAMYGQSLAGKLAAKAKDRKPIDVEAALKRHNKDWKPLIERTRRAAAGLPITKNPLYNLYLKLTRQDQLPKVTVVDPSEGMIPVGKTADEILKEIADKAKP